MMKKIDIAGKKFGRLTVIEEAGRDPRGLVTWSCECDCGRRVVKAGADLARGRIVSCGCMPSGRRFTATHGQTGTALHNRWLGMIRRTTDPNSNAYASYGGRGITVCDRWKAFENFAADMGPTFSSDLELDRIDVNGNYEPANCRWVTRIQQARNRRDSRYLSFRGADLTLAEWAELLHMKGSTIRNRIDRQGWTVERALTEGLVPHVLERLNAATDAFGRFDPDCYQRPTADDRAGRIGARNLTFRGRTMTVTEWAKLLGIKHVTLYSRLNQQGWSVERALTTGVDPEVLARLGGGTSGEANS
jgi:hypothetical protein